MIGMKWYETKSVEELKSLGKLKSVKMEINKDIKRITGRKNIDNFMKMGSNSWKGLFEKINSLKKLIGEFSENNGKDIDCDLNVNYFKSEADRYIFCLLELSGEERMKQLKIYKSLYMNKNIAKEWYKEIAKSIHPDVCKCERADEAMAELTSIYNKMVNV